MAERLACVADHLGFSWTGKTSADGLVVQPAWSERLRRLPGVTGHDGALARRSRTARGRRGGAGPRTGGQAVVDSPRAPGRPRAGLGGRGRQPAPRALGSRASRSFGEAAASQDHCHLPLS